MDHDHLASWAANGFHGWRILLMHLVEKGAFTETEAAAILAEVLIAEGGSLHDEGIRR